MEQQYAKYLLEKTRRDYNKIAEDFSGTRSKMWKELGFLEEYLKEKDRALDIGCGNGRLYELLREREIEYYGVDFSEKLIDIAKSKFPLAKFQVADGLELPFSDNFFDKAVSIAVLHHIPSEKFRLEFLKEAQRVLKPGGVFILTVWNLNKRRKSLLLLKYTILKILGKTQLDFGDVFVPGKGIFCAMFIVFLKKN